MTCPTCKNAEAREIRVRILDRDPKRPDEVNKIEGCERCFWGQVGHEDPRAARRHKILKRFHDGIVVTQADIDHKIEHGSKAERWPKEGGGYDLHPVSLTSVTRRTIPMSR